MSPIYVDRDTLDSFHSDALGQQADLTRDSINSAPPIPQAPPPSPPPPDPAAPTPSSDSLTNPTRQSPPELQDLMASAGLSTPQPSGSGAGGAAPAPSSSASAPGEPPALGDLLHAAGLGDLAGSVGGAATGIVNAARGAIGSAPSPPALSDILSSAGLGDQQPSNGITAKVDQVQNAVQTVGASARTRISQFESGLSDGDAYAACGPVAAAAFAQAFGRNPTPQEALDLARKVGWTQGGGMNGVSNEAALLKEMGISAHLETDVNWQHVAQDATSGNPVIISTPGHYYVVDGFDPQTGRFHEATRAERDLKGGAEWMTAADMERLMGTANGALYADNPSTPSSSVATAQPVTQTTAGMSGGGALAGQVGDRGMQILSAGAQAASWLGDQGQKALQSVLVTEGGLNNARGDSGKSAGPLQFYEGGQLANLAQQLGKTLEDTKAWVEQNPTAAVQWAIGTPDKPGYLGAAIQRGIQLGLSGADLATFAQRTGQVSDSPERAGANWNALFGGGKAVIQAATSTAAGAVQGAQNSAQGLVDNANTLVGQGQGLIDQANQGVQSVSDYTQQKLAPINAEADRLTAQNQQAADQTLQANQAAQDQRSLAASQATLGGGLAGRSAEFNAGGGAGQTPEQILANQAVAPAAPQQPKSVWQNIGDTISNAITSGLQQAFGGNQPPAAAVAALPLAPVAGPLAAGEATLAAAAPTVAGAVPQAASAIASSPPGQAVGSVLGAIGHANDILRGPASPEFPTGGPAAGPIVGATRQVVGFEQLARENPEYAALKTQYDSLQSQQDSSGMSAANADPAFIQRAQQMQSLRQQMDQIASTVNRPELAARAPDIAEREQTAQTVQNVAGGAVLGGVAGLPELATNALAIGIDPSNVVNLPFEALKLIDQAGQIARRVAPAAEDLVRGRQGAYVQIRGVPASAAELPEGMVRAGELGTMSTRENLPNASLWEATPGARYSDAEGEFGFHPPPVTQTPLVPGTENLPQQQRVRQVIADLVPNERIPRDLEDPQANAFADAMRANGASVGRGEWTPEQTTLSALLTRFSQGRGQTPAAKMYSGLGEEFMLRQRPSLQTQGATTGGAASYGLVIRPETMAAHIAGDTANPDMMEMLTAIARPSAEEVAAGTPMSQVSFATRQERAEAIQRGVDEFYRLAAAGGQGGDRGDRALITGAPIIRQGVPTGSTGRQAWSEAIPELHRTIQDWGTMSGRYAGLDEAGAKAQLLEDLQNAGVAGIGIDKAPFVANMGFSPEYGILDLRMRRQVFGLSPKAQITRAERDVLEQKLADAWPKANSNYVAQWLPWAYMTDEKTDYTSIASAYNDVGGFMQHAQQVADQEGRPMGEVVRELAAQTPKVPVDFPASPQDVITRIGISPQVIKQLPPGTSGEALRKAAPELEAFRRQAGVTFVEKPSVGTGLGIGPDGLPVTEPDADLLLHGPQTANRYFGAAWLAANPQEDSIMLAHLGQGGSDSLATIELKGVTQADLANLHQSLTDFSPDGWHTKVRLDKKGGQEVTSIVVGGVGKDMSTFEPDVRSLVQALRDSRYNVTASRVEPAQIEFMGQSDVPEVLYGGPRGATTRDATATAEGAGVWTAPSAGQPLGGQEPVGAGAGGGPNAPPVRDVSTPSGGIGASLADLARSRAPGRVAIAPGGEAAAAPAGVDRFYHGTAGDFPRPDAARFDEHGLYGPGYYLTSDPRVAGGVIAEGGETDQLGAMAKLAGPNADYRFAPGDVMESGYAQQRNQLDQIPPAPVVERQLEMAKNRFGALERDLQSMQIPDDMGRAQDPRTIRLQQGMVDDARADVERYQRYQDILNNPVGPNVRPVDVPRDLNLLDAEARVAPNVVDQIDHALSSMSDNLDPLHGSRLSDEFQMGISGTGQETGSEVYQSLVHALDGRRDQANDVLQQLGFDGIRYDGGKRVPMSDATGTPIDHKAMVVFPNALDKLRNAASGTAGGKIAPTFATDVAGAAAGGVAGNQSTPDDASPLERGARIAAGAALGGTVAHVGVGALLRAKGDLPMSPEDLLPQRESAGRLGGRVQIGPVPAAVQQVAQQVGGSPGSPRSFDLNALSQMRQQFAAQQPPLMPTGQTARRTPLDNFIGYTMANMLWGIGTAVHITTSQMLQTLGRPLVTVASGHPVEAVRDLAAMGDSISTAFANAGRTIQTGQRQGMALQTPPLPGAAGAVLGFPLRAHSAINEFFRTLNGAGASAAEASRLLRENPTLSFQDVLQRFPQQIVNAGADGAARATFMAGGGAMRNIGEQFGQMSRDLMNSGDPAAVTAGLVMRWVVPMTHIPAVILGEGIRNLPVVNEVRGVQRAVQLARGAPARTLPSGQVVPAVAGDAYLAQQELGRTALTSFANFAILSEVAQGNITGDGPTSPAERERLMEAVDDNGNAMWRPNSIKLPGGRWLDYSSLGPIALSMSSIANLTETAKDYANKPPETRGDIPQLAQELVNRQAGTIGKTWFLRGLADALGMIKDGNISTAAGSEVGSIGDRLVPFGSLLNEVRGFTDPLQRNPQNPLERVESRMPILSENVQPRLAASTGQPMTKPVDVSSFLLRGTPPGMMAPNPVAAEVARLHDQGIDVSLPYEVSSYKGARQTPQQQQTIREQVGGAINLYVSNTLADPKYAALSDDQKASAIKQAVGQAQSAADINIDQQVARSPHDSALLQWSQTPQYAGISSNLPPEEIARQNWEISQAKAKMSDYRKQYGAQAESRLRRDDPQAFRLSERDSLDSEILKRRKAAIDSATGGALSQAADQAATGGLVGVGSTTLPSRPPVP